jgi:SAM-dependent methyltransferase
MKSKSDYLEYNRKAWDHQVRNGNRWTLPCSEEIISAARNGNWNVVLTPATPVPQSWFPAKGSSILGLASAGGQQCPVFAAAGYEVTVFDNSPEQLKQDEITAEKFQLTIKTVQGDMMDLSVFEDASFDAVFNPCSTCFVPDVTKVYKEVARVLRPGGIFMTGFTNPVFYLFDLKLVESGVFTLKYRFPYSDLDSLDTDELNNFIEKNEPLIFGHSLEQLLNGQLKTGLILTDLFEDTWGDKNPIDSYLPVFMATRAVKKS